MRVVTSADAPIVRPQGHHREGSIQFQIYLQGEAGTPGFYTLNVASFEKYYTPRHRHNYDQIRFCLSGSFSYARDKYIPEGWIGYFPEGTFYGPQDVDTTWELSPRVLTHQFGGASMQGFLSGRLLASANEQMAQSGRFEQGFYVSVGSDGVEHKQDGYEAAWAMATGQELRYPSGRFAEPVLMDPSAHRWTPSDFPGVEEKLLGVFGEGRTKIAFYRLDSGAVATFGPRRAVTTLFSLEGDMIVDGVDLAEGTTVEVGVGETVSISTKAGVEVYLVDLPDLSYWS